MDKMPVPGPVSPNCVSPADLARYFTNALDRSEADVIESHLLECEYCRALSDQVADAAQALYEQDLAPAPITGLGFLTEETEPWLGKELPAKMIPRIERWVSMGAEITARVALPRLGELASFVVSGMEAMLSPSSDFMPERASVPAFMGMIDAADHGELTGPVLEIPGEGRKRARIVIDVGETTRVSVQVDNVPAGMITPLAAVRLQELVQTIILEMTPVESISGDPSVIGLIAHFDLPKTVREVLVLVEPFDE